VARRFFLILFILATACSPRQAYDLPEPDVDREVWKVLCERVAGIKNRQTCCHSRGIAYTHQSQPGRRELPQASRQLLRYGAAGERVGRAVFVDFSPFWPYDAGRGKLVPLPVHKFRIPMRHRIQA
jgi:hypothetical protein